MNIKLFSKLITVAGLLLSSAVLASAQGAIGFKGGLWVAMKSEVVTAQGNQANVQLKTLSTGTTLKELPTGTTSSTSGEKMFVHRVLTDAKNNLYFGYDLEVTRDADPNKYSISVKSLSIDAKKFLGVGDMKPVLLPKYPADIVVDDGATVSLEILEEPATNAKLVDFIKVTTKHADFESFFPESIPVKDFTIDDLELRLSKAEVFVNGEKLGGVGGVSGNLIWFTLPKKGRFIFSLFPKAGYEFKKIAVAEDTKITFNYNGDEYKVTSNSIISPGSGRWNMWVLYDPNYKSAGVEFGAADAMKYLIGEQSPFKGN